MLSCTFVGRTATTTTPPRSEPHKRTRTTNGRDFLRHLPFNIISCVVRHNYEITLQNLKRELERSHFENKNIDICLQNYYGYKNLLQYVQSIKLFSVHNTNRKNVSRKPNNFNNNRYDSLVFIRTNPNISSKFLKDESNLSIKEIRRHRAETTIFQTLRDTSCTKTGLPRLPASLITLIGSLVDFDDSNHTDYKTLKQIRSEYGLEKADGLLYTMHKAVHKGTGTQVLIETFELQDDVLPEYLNREMDLSKTLQTHENVWRIIDVIREKNKIFIVRPNTSGKTLSNVIQGNNRKKKLTGNIIKSYMKQLLSFVNACHEKDLILDGLSSGSIHVDVNNRLKVSRNPANFYDPPERLLADTEEKRQRIQSTKKDMWSLGCVFGKLALGQWLFSFDRNDTTDMEVLMKIFKSVGSPTVEEWPQVLDLHEFFNDLPKYEKKCLKTLVGDNLCDDGVDLLGKMLTYNPRKRISAEEALSHPYLKDFQDFQGHHNQNNSKINKIKIKSSRNPYMYNCYSHGGKTFVQPSTTIRTERTRSIRMDDPIDRECDEVESNIKN
eukprot:UN30861